MTREHDSGISCEEAQAHGARAFKRTFVEQDFLTPSLLNEGRAVRHLEACRDNLVCYRGSKVIKSIQREVSFGESAGDLLIEKISEWESIVISTRANESIT